LMRGWEINFNLCRFVVDTIMSNRYKGYIERHKGNWKMTKGKYTVKITADATGSFFTLMTYEDRGVPGFPGKYYATRANAERAAKKMLLAA